MTRRQARKDEVKRAKLKDLELWHEDPMVIEEASKRGISVPELIETVRLSMENDDGTSEMMRGCPRNVQPERMTFKYLKVLIPPAHAAEPPVLARVFRKIRDNDPIGLDDDTLATVYALIAERWRPNYTLLDRNW